MAATVVGDGAQALRGERVELEAPDRRAERPAMDEDDRPAGAVVDREQPLAVVCLEGARAARVNRSSGASAGAEEGASIHRMKASSIDVNKAPTPSGVDDRGGNE